MYNILLSKKVLLSIVFTILFFSIGSSVMESSCSSGNPDLDKCNKDSDCSYWLGYCGSEPNCPSASKPYILVDSAFCIHDPFFDKCICGSTGYCVECCQASDCGNTNCGYGSWTNKGCGLSPCSANQMKQERTRQYSTYNTCFANRCGSGSCDQTSRCVSDPACQCKANGQSCSSDSECCSNICCNNVCRSSRQCTINENCGCSYNSVLGYCVQWTNEWRCDGSIEQIKVYEKWCYSNCQCQQTEHWLNNADCGSPGYTNNYKCSGKILQREYCDKGCSSSTGRCYDNGCYYKDYQTCTYCCSGSSCTGVCSPGSTQSQSCGNCGTQTCQSNCQWGTCTGQGVCSPGSTKDTGIDVCYNNDVWNRIDKCSSSCQWYDDGHSSDTLADDCTSNEKCENGKCVSICACTPGQTQSQSCGNCGTQTRTCQSNCQWGSYGSCTGEGVCSPGSTDSQSCGNCNTGTQTRTCQTNCQWGSFGECTGEGCSPGTTTNCGDCGIKTCQSNCQFGSCTKTTTNCPSTKNQCGEFADDCTLKDNNYNCNYNAIDTKCIDPNTLCNENIYNCEPVGSTGCCYDYSTCLEKAQNPDTAPYSEDECIEHGQWTSSEC